MEQQAQLNTSNPDAIVYQTEELGFTILGGIRLDGLDRLRVKTKSAPEVFTVMEFDLTLPLISSL